MDDLSATQLRRALNAAYELAELRDLDEFPARAAALLHEAVPCDHAGYNAIDVTSGTATVVADPPETVFDGGPEALAEFGHQSPLIVLAAGGDTSVLRLSDHISRRELHRTDLYHHVYKVIALEYQLGVQLPPLGLRPGRATEFVGLSLARTHEDFGEGDRAVLAALQPLLAATFDRLHELALLRAAADTRDATSDAVVLVDADGTIAWASTAAVERLGLAVSERLNGSLRGWLSAERAHGRSESTTLELAGLVIRPRLVPGAYPALDAIHLGVAQALPDASALRSLGLTLRQAEVLALAIEGSTARDIAERLHLSARTVEKHFETIYGHLGVRNRSEAISATLRRIAA